MNLAYFTETPSNRESLFFQGEYEFQSAFLAVDGTDLATVESDGIADYRQAEPRTAVIACTAFRNSVEPLENTGQVLLFDPVACIVIGEMAESFALCIALHMDGDAVSGVFDTVLDQVPEYSIK